MAVSKIAVMALVGILAVPILLGYALNLSEVTETDYKPDGESTNVTPLLQTGTAYTPANADSFKINTDFEYNGIGVKPIFNTISTNKSSLQIYQQTHTLAPGGYLYFRLSSYDNGLSLFIGRYSDVTFVENDSAGQNRLHTIDHFVSMNWNPSDNKVTYSYDGGSSFFTPTSTSNIIGVINNGSTTKTLYISQQNAGGVNYADISDGYYFENVSWYGNVKLHLPEKTKSILLTVDLDSITDSNYKLIIDAGLGMVLTKTTDSNGVKWSLLRNDNQGDGEVIFDNLYYNSSSSNNTYQIYLNADLIGTREWQGQYDTITYYKTKYTLELRYIGQWPSIFGLANSYMNYNYDYTRESTGDNTFDQITFKTPPSASPGRTPTMRMDGAVFSAFAYSIISDITYTPGDFKTNPTTTLTVEKPGTSFEFAGNTYTVDNTGNITLGTHKVSVDGLKLESIPVPVGYENRINGNVISVSADPSTIKFNGQWGASVSTIGNTATTYTKTEWNAGTFAWDGIDTNFLIVGLITCLGAFIALGIYLRKTGKGLMPLLIVCGCAAGLFFCMI